MMKRKRSAAEGLPLCLSQHIMRPPLYVIVTKAKRRLRGHNFSLLGTTTYHKLAHFITRADCNHVEINHSERTIIKNRNSQVQSLSVRNLISKGLTPEAFINVYKDICIDFSGTLSIRKE